MRIFEVTSDKFNVHRYRIHTWIVVIQKEKYFNNWNSRVTYIGPEIVHSEFELCSERIVISILLTVYALNRGD